MGCHGLYEIKGGRVARWREDEVGDFGGNGCDQFSKEVVLVFVEHGKLCWILRGLRVAGYVIDCVDGVGSGAGGYDPGSVVGEIESWDFRSSVHFVGVCRVVLCVLWWCVGEVRVLV